MKRPFTRSLLLWGICMAYAFIQPAWAQTTGDLAFVGFNADGNDGFAFVTLVDIPANTDIWFTDEEWDSSTMAFASTTSEGDVVWSNGAMTLAGTVIDIDGLSATPIASLGTVTAGTNGGAGLSSSSEGLYAYLGTQRNPTTFLTAITNGTWGGSPGDLGNTGLVAGTTAIEFTTAADVGAYTGPRLGQNAFSDYSPIIYDLATNWIFDDGSGDQSSDGNAPDAPFDITPFALGTTDVTPPLATGLNLLSATSAELIFNEDVDATTVAVLTNFSFSPAITINSATISGGDTVILDFAALTDGVQYQLTVSNIADTATNVMTTPAQFDVLFNGTTPPLVITEILYNNPGTDSLEFLELYNAGATPIELGGFDFVQGITFTFPAFSLPAGSTVLLALDTAAASGFFGVNFPFQFGGALSNGGEDVIIVNTLGDTIDIVDYDDASPWPTAADGAGPSMELLNPSFENNDGANWFASITFQDTLVGADSVFATPGTVNMFMIATVAFQEVSVSVIEDSVTEVKIPFTISEVTGDTAKFDIALTAFATATNGADFAVADTQSFAYAAGQANFTDTLTVTINGDTDAENDEYFSFRMIHPENVEITGDGFTSVYIQDDDRLAPVATEAISLSILSTFDNVPGAENAAEIVTYDPTSGRVFVANSVNNSVDILDYDDPANPAPISSIDISPMGAINSIAVYDTIVAAAIQDPDKTMPGLVVFFDTTGVLLDSVRVGALPDMITFTPDGSKVLTANEGEPNDDYSIDPEGSIAIVDMTAGVGNLTQADVTIAGFGDYNGQQAALEASGVRISGPAGTTVAQDLEPEYIAVAADGSVAWVTCQENSAVAVVDLALDSVSAIIGMGTKDWTVPGAGLDATNEGDEIHIANYPFKGLYMPDAIASYEVGGVPYLITANEGDGREYDTFEDESRLGDGDYELDETAFPDGDILKSVVGRIKTINTEGDTDGDGDFDEIFTLGARSFTIWNGQTGAIVYDSGDDFELITSQDSAISAIFNANDDGLTPKNRSDDKGPEPEAVVVGEINGLQYAFVALERVGGVMVYDVTDPMNPEFVQYVNNRSTTMETGDLAPEGLFFIPSDQNPTGKPLLLVASEVSSTVTVWEIDGEITGRVEFAEAQQTVGEDADSISVELVLDNGSVESETTVEVTLATFATATEGSDFTASTTTTVTFPAGQGTATAKFEIIDDSDIENDEYFAFRLENPMNAFLADQITHTVYVQDDDRLAAPASEDITLDLVTSFATGVQGDDAAEIVAYDAGSQRLVVSNSAANEIDLVDFSDPTNPTQLSPIDISQFGAINSVATFNGIIAAAIENADKQMPGSVVFFDTQGTQLAQVTTGALPDMVTFTPDGQTVLTANEGEPNDDYTVDPEGSVSIIDISGGVANLTQADVTTADFTAFNAQEAQLKAAGVRIFGPGANVAQDLEPEYITVSADGATAWVTCQENNAVAVVDISAKTITDVLPLGFKDFSMEGAGLDAEDRSDEIRIANYPINGMYQPDAIASYEIGGTTYLVTANEGDARDYDGYSEEARLGDEEYPLDSAAFPDGDLLKENIGRLKTTLANGDTDGDGDYDEIYAYGGRSFSIWNGSTGDLVYDSGDDIELTIAQDPVYNEIFNTTDDELDFKNRSDDKGPEPEAVVVGEINNKQYAFLALERVGGVMVFDVTDPTAPTFTDYD
ncbi:MAG: choice-of-anchor I family protein, partial [Bacteroidota bacterium]